MLRRYSDIAFTEGVKRIQSAQGSRDAYARWAAVSAPDAGLDPAAREFIATRDGFYVASVSETGWPYVQFRGGPRGFLRVMGATELGFADFRGNRQYVTTGNVAADDRVALFLMDYPSGRRLKLFGRMRAVESAADPELVARCAIPGYAGSIERAFLITVEAVDWNCPRHITPRFTIKEIFGDSALRRRICSAAATELGAYDAN